MSDTQTGSSVDGPDQGPLLDVEGLSIEYETEGENIRAVSDISFTIERGNYFGLVGESGSGKTTIVQSLIGGLDQNATITSGTIRYDGTEIQNLSDGELNEDIRWTEISYISQGSMNSLDPLMKLSEQAHGIAAAHTDWTKAETIDRFSELFEVVGLSPDRIHEYPHNFSGGMKQRVSIALSLLLEPSLLIADEPTTALDVIMQDQILEYLEGIRAGRDMSMILITHDISLVYETCDSFAVLHGGQVAESGDTFALFDNPRHPYTKALDQSTPDVRNHDKTLENIPGHPPELRDEVNYCTFADRCPLVVDECRQSAPPLERISSDPEHLTSCIRHDEL